MGRTPNNTSNVVAGRGPSTNGPHWGSRTQDVAWTSVRDGERRHTRGHVPDKEYLSWRSQPAEGERSLARERYRGGRGPDLSWRSQGRPSALNKGDRGPDRDEPSRRSLVTHGGRRDEISEDFRGHSPRRDRYNLRSRPRDHGSHMEIREPSPRACATPEPQSTQGSRSERVDREERGHNDPENPTGIPTYVPVVQHHPVEDESPPTPPPFLSNGGLSEEQEERSPCVIIEEIFYTDDVKTPQEVGALWIGRDFLSEGEGEDVDTFISEQEVELTAGGPQRQESRAGGLRAEELSQQLSELLQGSMEQHQIQDWLEAHVEEELAASNQFVAILMTCFCQVAMKVSDEVALRLLRDRAGLLHQFLDDQRKQLQALYVLQALMVEMNHPNNLLMLMFDALFDADVISQEVFQLWEASEDPEQQEGKASA